MSFSLKWHHETAAVDVSTVYFYSEQVVSNRADSACVLWPETDTLTSLVIRGLF